MTSAGGKKQQSERLSSECSFGCTKFLSLCLRNGRVEASRCGGLRSHSPRRAGERTNEQVCQAPMSLLLLLYALALTGIIILLHVVEVLHNNLLSNISLCIKVFLGCWLMWSFYVLEGHLYLSGAWQGLQLLTDTKTEKRLMLR